jgi:hypothetical protein
MSLRWLAQPEGAAAELGMPLLDGVARSTQIGDLGAFFFSLGAFALLGAITFQRSWFNAAVFLVGGAAVFRILAALLQDAAFALDLIAPELVIAAILFASSRLLCSGEKS